MGNCVSILKRKREPNKSITLAIIGLDDAGKTTICSVLSGEQPDLEIAPTVGFRNVKFTQCNFDVTLFDVGGGRNIRPIWKNYYGEVFAIIYVIDSSMPAGRLPEARDVFRESLEHPQLSGKPVLVLANKMDKEAHMTESDITHGLRLEETVNFSNCPSKLVLVSAIQGAGSKMDKGISEGIEWLLQKVRTLLPSLEPRVEEDMRREKEARDKEREERRARVKKQREEREKAEELERSRLGLEKKPDSDDDDIVDGNPFKALDMNELKKKEQRLKAEKKEKQKRMKDLGYGDGLRQSTDTSTERYLGRKGYKNHLSDDDGPTGLKMDEIETAGSAMAIFGRGNRAAILPPLEPLGSAALEGSVADKKRQKKKKRLTDYHLEESSDQADMSRTIDRLGLSIPSHLGGDSNVHDLTPRNAKPRAPHGLIQAGRISKEEDEREGGIFKRGSAASRGIHLVGGIDDDSDDGTRKPVRSSQERLKTRSALGELDMYGGKKITGLERYPREAHGDALMYRNSLTKISPPNLRPFEEEDEGIEQDDSDNNNRNANNNSDDDDAAELERFRANRRAHKLGSARVRREGLDAAERGRRVNDGSIHDRYQGDSKKVKGNSTGFSARHKHQDSDDDEEDDDGQDEYGTYNPLKDTLRFSYDDTRDLTKEMENLRKRQMNSEYRDMNGYSGHENRGYSVSPTKPRTRLRGNSNDYDDDDYTLSRGSRGVNSRNLQSPEEYEDYKEKVTDQRKKKKRNLLRSNKLGPSENDDMQRFGSPRMVQEHGSRNASDAETPTKNRNSRITQFNRNDSDFNTKWGLAEDLPAIDDSFRRRRVPNFDDSDEGDVVF